MVKSRNIEEDGRIEYPEAGTPQGGSISPILANIYLHYVIDEWFETKVKPNCDGEAILCRYADDFVCAFQYSRDADRFYKVLPKRLGKYNLQVAPEKTNRLRFSRFQSSLKNRFTFLSFEFYWDSDKTGKPRLFRRTARKRLQSTKNDYSEYIKKSRHMRTAELLDKLSQKLRGHFNYFGAVGNLDSLFVVYHHVVGKLYKWLNRRSGRRSMTWERLKRLITYRALVRPECRVITGRQKVWW